MSVIMSTFIKFNKVMGVNIINTLASQLKTGLSIAEFSGGIKEYQASISTINNFSFIGQFNYQNRGIACIIDPKIIIMSTQRTFGGSSEIEPSDSTTFTFTENFIGKSILVSVENYFNEKQCQISLNRIEHNKERSHLFFSDEQVVFVEMNCTNNGQDIGKIALIYPLTFVKQEKEKWQ